MKQTDNIFHFLSNKFFLISILTFLALNFMIFAPHHLFDWDEVNFAESAREMIETNDYTTVQIDYKPFWEKPPLFFWLQVVSMKVLGINEFAARFPNFLAGLIVVFLLFNIGKRFFDKKFGYYFSGIYLGSFLPFAYFNSGIIDPWFNLFIFSGIYFFMLVYIDNEHIHKYLLLSAISISAAILTKGPVGLLIFLLTYFFVLVFYIGFKKIIHIKYILLYGLYVVLFGGSWFILLVLQGKTNIIVDFVLYQIRLFSTQDAGHGGPFYYHFVVILFGLIPFSLFAIYAFKRSIKSKLNSNQKMLYNWMFVLFWVVMILFSIVKTKIIHYSSMAYYPMAFFGALAFYEREKEDKPWNKFYVIGTAFIVLLYTVALLLLPYIEHNKQEILSLGILKDPFAEEAVRTVSVSWGTGYIIASIVSGIILILTVLTVNKHKNPLVLALYATFFYSQIFTAVIKVEHYSQGTAIEFYKKFQGKKVYVYPLGFKSYAHLFYTQKKPDMPAITEAEMLNCKAKYPAYAVVKINSAKEKEKQYPNLKKLYQKGGFVFYKVGCK